MSPPTPPPLPAFLQLKQAGAGPRGRRQVQLLLPRDTGETSTDDHKEAYCVVVASSSNPRDIQLVVHLFSSQHTRSFTAQYYLKS